MGKYIFDGMIRASRRKGGHRIKMEKFENIYNISLFKDIQTSIKDIRNDYHDICAKIILQQLKNLNIINYVLFFTRNFREISFIFGESLIMIFSLFIIYNFTDVSTPFVSHNLHRFEHIASF